MTDPALVPFDPPEGDGPRTHVLLVGIGTYPHLSGGGETLAEEDFGLEQLLSPPASARAMADWFLTQFSCLDRPLGSLALILSEAGAAATPYVNPVTAAASEQPRGTLEDLRLATEAWVARGVDPDDQLILYFCGHGLSGGLQSIYPARDYGVRVAGPLDRSVNLQRLLAGLESALASNQLLIFDACRSQDDVVGANGAGGNGLLFARPQRRLGVNQALQQCVLFSTERDRPALGGRNGQPTLCANALIRALGGAAAKKPVLGDGWHVNSTRLLDAMNEFQVWTLGPSPVQRGDFGRFADLRVRRMNEPPKMPVFIRRKDRTSLAGASIQCFADGTDTVVAGTAALDGAEWEDVLPLGPHRIEVSLGAGRTYPPLRETVSPYCLSIELETV